MTTTVTFVRVHEPDAVREILRQAGQMAATQAATPEQWEHVFAKAVDLLAARLPLTPVQGGGPVDLSRLRTG